MLHSLAAINLNENHFTLVYTIAIIGMAPVLDISVDLHALDTTACAADAHGTLASEQAKLPSLALVVPCYNEEAALPETCRQLRELLSQLIADGIVNHASTIVLVDDGSRDRTWDLIEAANKIDCRVKGLKLSRNQGHQNALLAGLLSAKGDVLISLDADLQDDLGAVERMLAAHARGADIVFGVRARRDVDTPFKRQSARLFYRMMNGMGVETVADHADFRLMSRRSIEALRDFGEVNLFLRGIVPMLGFKTETVTYDRKARIAGETHYPLRRMLGLAADGVLAFSTMPLQLIFYVGIIISMIAGGLACWALGVRLMTDDTVPGWASVVIPMYFLGGLQMLALGIMGGYLARIYAETKKRPRFIVQQCV
jgi:polyisoprenyl-phosphate glycosyltransferase